MKNITDFIFERRRTVIKNTELKVDAADDERKAFAKDLAQRINVWYCLSKQWTADDMLDALNRLSKENYPIHLMDFGLNDDCYLAFDNGENALQFNDEDGWTEIKK